MKDAEPDPGRAVEVDAGGGPVCCPGIEDLFDTRFFKALGDPNRITILVQLARRGCPCTVSELSLCCPVDLSVVSRHLGVLRDAGIVQAERSGKQVFYTARLTEVAKELGAIADALREAAQSHDPATGRTC